MAFGISHFNSNISRNIKSNSKLDKDAVLAAINLLARPGATVTAAQHAAVKDVLRKGKMTPSATKELNHWLTMHPVGSKMPSTSRTENGASGFGSSSFTPTGLGSAGGIGSAGRIRSAGGIGSVGRIRSAGGTGS